MRRLFFYLKLYLKTASQYLKARMQYRADFFISLIGSLFHNVIAILFLLILFRSISALAGYGLYELLFMYAFFLLTGVPAQFFFDNIWQLRRHLQEGTFIKYYFKPLNIMFYYMSDSIDLKSIGNLMLGVAAFFYASCHLHINWTFPKGLLFCALLFFASLIVISLMVIAASTGFWLVNPTMVLTFTNKLRENARYPITIFNNVFKFVFSYIIPLGFIVHYPLQIFLNEEIVPVQLYFTPLVGIVFFVLAYKLWQKGATFYSATGS